jgi:flagellin FlaB
VKKKMKIKQSLRKLLKQNRGMVGIEAAIVLIAFVIVAAAFAFMVVNMGLFATQSGKSTIQSGISEASSPLIVDGDIMLRANATAPYYVDAMMVPLQVVGIRYVPMDANSTQITLTISGQSAIANCYYGVNASTINTIDPYSTKMDNLVNYTGSTPLSNGGTITAAELFIGNSNNNTSLDSNEKGFLMVYFAPQDRPVHGQTIYIQIRPQQDAPIAVDFKVSAQLSTGWSTVGS